MQNHLKDLLQIEIDKILDDIVKLRHKFHKIPEESFNENLTTKLIIGELHKAGVDKVERPLQTGAVGILSGTNPDHSDSI